MVDLSEVDLSQINTDKLKLFLQFALTILENYEEKRIRLQFEEGPYKLDSLIPLYEKALNKTYDLLEKGIENLKQKGYVSHVHLHNIATTFLKLLDALKENYSHEKSVYFNSELFDLIIDDAIKRCETLGTEFKPIYDVLISSATKREKYLLLRPYKFDFQATFNSTLRYPFYSLSKNYNELYDLVSEEYLKRIATKETPSTIEALPPKEVEN